MKTWAFSVINQPEENNSTVEGIIIQEPRGVIGRQKIPWKVITTWLSQGLKGLYRNTGLKIVC